MASAAISRTGSWTRPFFSASRALWSFDSGGQASIAAADGLQFALLAQPQLAPRGALLQDTQTAKAEIEPDRVFGIDAPEERRNFSPCSRIGPFARRRPEVLPQPKDMGIDRELQTRWLLHAPESKVDAIVTPDDPPQKEIQPLACAWTVGAREEIMKRTREIGNALIVSRSAGRIEPGSMARREIMAEVELERGGDEAPRTHCDIRFLSPPVLGRRPEPFDGPPSAQHLAQQMKEGAEIAINVEPVIKAAQGGVGPARDEVPGEPRRRRADTPQEIPEGAVNLGNVAVSESGRDKRGDFPVGAALVAAGPVQRVAPDPLGFVIAMKQSLEERSDPAGAASRLGPERAGGRYGLHRGGSQGRDSVLH